MKKTLLALLALLILAAVWQGGRSSALTPPPAPEAQVGHMVFFQLKDNSPEAKAKLVAACNKHLSGHEGTVYYSAGTRAEEFTREVNDQEFDVALHLVFKDKAAHDTYQEHARHKQFIEENRANWKKVRVFDSYMTPVTP
jgi:hypothetical protein